MIRRISSALKYQDRQLYRLLDREFHRQQNSLELIASENTTSPAVLECLGSVLTNKYSEGLPGKRYYGGNEVIDEVEKLCQERALGAYRLNPEEWGVNVQPYSGSVANMAAYLGLLSPHDRLMGLYLPAGGHLTHGFYTSKKRVSSTSIFFESLAYGLNSKGYLDYDGLEVLAKQFCPKLLICGYSAYPRDLDYERFRQIADLNGSYLLCDMAHFSGLVATQQLSDPFPFCDVVTTTTHKTLRGPRSGMIFYRKHLADQINNAVFPGLQGGPHNHQIAALAAQLAEVVTPEFRDYIKMVKDNAKTLANSLIDYQYDLCTEGTDNHIVLVDLRKQDISGSKVEMTCDAVGISLNKNSVPGDTSALNPGGIRLGTSSLTTRGFKSEEFKQVAKLLQRSIEIAREVQQSHGKGKKAFKNGLQQHRGINDLSQDVKLLANKFKLYP